LAKIFLFTKNSAFDQTSDLDTATKMDTASLAVPENRFLTKDFTKNVSLPDNIGLSPQ